MYLTADVSGLMTAQIDGGVIEDIPITLGGLWCVDQATAPNVSRGQWFYMGRPIKRVSGREQHSNANAPSKLTQVP